MPANRNRVRYTVQTVETAAIAAWSLVHGLAMLLIDGVLHGNLSPNNVEVLVARVLHCHLRSI